MEYNRTVARYIQMQSIVVVKLDRKAHQWTMMVMRRATESD
jgi:hypothetical protein